jgi:hypothetical protein
MFCAPVLVFKGYRDVGSRFHVLRSQIPFRLYRGRRVAFSCIARPDLFLAAPRASGPVFMFCAPGLVFGSTEGVGSRFHVLSARTRFRRYRWRQIPFTCFARPDSFSTVPRALGPVFMFCTTRLVLNGTKGVGSRFHVLRARNHCRRFRGRRVPFPCFARPDSFSAVPRASSPIFMFCAPGLVFGVTEGVGSRFNVYAPGLVFDNTEGVESRFHVLRTRTRFRLYRGRPVTFSSFTRPDSFSTVPSALGPVFMFCSLRVIFGGVVCVGSHFHVLRPRTRFRRYRGRRIPFSCFVSPDSFSAIPRASDPVFMFCAPRLIFDVTEGVGSHFRVGSRFHVLRSDSFSEVQSASCLVYMFCAPGLVFGGTEGIGSRFHILRSRTHFRRYRGRRVPFSCFARKNSFSAMSSASGPVFMFFAAVLVFSCTEGVGSRFHFCAPGLIFGDSEGVGSRFHVLCARTHFRR